MRILHTADVHLDTPFSGLSADAAKMRKKELRDTFLAMMEYARDNFCDMVVIAGDLFDKDYITRDTVSSILGALRILECPVIITPGNHDPATEGSIWKKDLFSQNVYIFDRDELERIDFDNLGCTVYGYGFTSPSMDECPIQTRVENEEDRLSLLVAHGDTVSAISKNAPLPVSVLKNAGFDYCMLGHIHNPEAANEMLGDIGAYCGCPEGRDFGETGVKGAYLIDIEKEDGKVRKTVHKVRFSKRKYEIRTVDVSGSVTNEDVAAAVRAFVAETGLGEDTLLRVILTGAVDTSLSIDTEFIAGTVSGLFHIEVHDSTSPTWNAEYLESDKGIRGEVYRTLLPKLSSEDAEERELASEALRYALSALEGEIYG